MTMMMMEEKKKERKQGIQTEKEETKLYLFTDDVLSMKKCPIMKSLGTVKDYRKAAGQEITMKKLVAFSCTNDEYLTMLLTYILYM